MEVEEKYSIDELYEKVKDYDIVFTSEAAMMSALNDRLDEPVLGYFATTPVIYTFEQFQNVGLIQERGLFIELVRNTDLSWKQSSYLLEKSSRLLEKTRPRKTVLNSTVSLILNQFRRLSM